MAANRPKVAQNFTSNQSVRGSDLRGPELMGYAQTYRLADSVNPEP